MQNFISHSVTLLWNSYSEDMNSSSGRLSKLTCNSAYSYKFMKCNEILFQSSPGLLNFLKLCFKFRLHFHTANEANLGINFFLDFEDCFVSDVFILCMFPWCDENGAHQTEFGICEGDSDGYWQVMTWISAVYMKLLNKMKPVLHLGAYQTETHEGLFLLVQRDNHAL